jgi:DNA (cytosine-5)-methyltransferase 1
MYQNYLSRLNNILQPQPSGSVQVLDLFAGCGGLSLGFEAQGFDVTGFEMEVKAVETYNHNLKGGCFAEKLTTQTVFDKHYDVVVGGPPCQPFSVGGHQKGLDDERNGFPVFLEAIEQIRPKVWMFENVRGMLYSNKWYFDEITMQLRDMGYIVEHRLLNAVKYGVPQNRERLFVVGHRGHFLFPRPDSQVYTVGDAIGDLIEQTKDESKILTASMDRYVANYERASSCVNPRDLYPNKPARTLTCRNIAAPTGDMQRVRLQDGRRRRISVREAARLQSFPDWFQFSGTESNQYYQIGNAVPPMLAYHLAGAVKSHLSGQSVDFHFKGLGFQHSAGYQTALF